MPFMAVSDNIVAVSRGTNVDYFDSISHKLLQLKLDSTTQEDDYVTDINISKDEKLLAILLTSSKRLLIYELPELKIIRSFTLPRTASKARFGVNNDKIFVADKTGDVVLYKIFKEDKGNKISGHLSLLLNVLQTDDGKYVITSDRDEKIKVYCYPNTYNIQTYCLGHTEFVNHIELIPDSSGHLISASGDGTVKVWNYTNGKLMYTINTYPDIKNNDELQHEFSKFMDEEGIEIKSLPIVDCSITQYKQCSSLIAITVHSYMKIMIYRLRYTTDVFEHDFITDLTLDVFPSAIQLHNSSLFVYDKVNSKVYVYNIHEKNDCISLELAKEIQVFNNEIVNTNSFSNHNSIKVLFKRKFDNVQEYQERKKLRLEKVDHTS